MRRYRIITPVPEWEGKVGTVNFVKGAAECEADADAAALYYFWCQGYGIEPLDDGPAYKPPGTKTVEDEIAEAQARLADLKARAEQAPPAPEAPTAAGTPKKSASTDEWRAYAVASGMPEEQAATKSRDELVATYTTEG